MLVIFPSPIPELQHTPLPLQSVMSQGACLDFLFFNCFLFGLTFESLKELGAHHNELKEGVELLVDLDV